MQLTWSCCNGNVREKVAAAATVRQNKGVYSPCFGFQVLVSHPHFYFDLFLKWLLKRHLIPTLTFLSRLLVPDEWRAFRKPAVVDQRVGFLLDGGGSSVWTRDSPLPNGPLTVSRAGSLLRRTWRGISEGRNNISGDVPK